MSLEPFSGIAEIKRGCEQLHSYLEEYGTDVTEVKHNGLKITIERIGPNELPAKGNRDDLVDARRGPLRNDHINASGHGCPF